jgi:hypothetical protein
MHITVRDGGALVGGVPRNGRVSVFATGCICGSCFLDPWPFFEKSSGSF